MARRFTSANVEHITVSIGAMNHNTPVSSAFIVQFATVSINQCMIVCGSTSGNRWIFYVTSANQLGYQPGVASTVHGTTTVAASKWYLVGFSFPGGANRVRFHIYDYAADSWVHEDSNANPASLSTPATSATIGTLQDNTTFPLNADIAVGGVWNASLSDAQMESLAGSLMSWWAPSKAALTSGLTGLWMFDQDVVAQTLIDMVGGANESGRTGTTVSANSVPVFNYGVGVHMVV